MIVQYFSKLQNVIIYMAPLNTYRNAQKVQYLLLWHVIDIIQIEPCIDYIKIFINHTIEHASSEACNYDVSPKYVGPYENEIYQKSLVTM